MSRRKWEKMELYLVECKGNTWKVREPQSHRKLTPSTWSSWLLLTNCSRRDVSSFFIKATCPSTVVLFCGKLLISCCCLVTFCGSKETGGKTESDTDRKNRGETGRVTSELMHANWFFSSPVTNPPYNKTSIIEDMTKASFPKICNILLKYIF